MKSAKIAILGGSFNPPTIAHMEMGRKILMDKYAEKLIYIPCGSRSDKVDLVEGHHRIKMLILNIASYFHIAPRLIQSDDFKLLHSKDKILIDDFELRVHKKLLPTALLFQHYERTYPNIRFLFVMGSDLLESITQWELYDEVLKSREYLIFKRDDYDIKDNSILPNSQVITDPNLLWISSTKVRNILEECQGDFKESCNQRMADLTKYVNKDVLEYIISHKLYFADS